MCEDILKPQSSKIPAGYAAFFYRWEVTERKRFMKQLITAILVIFACIVNITAYATEEGDKMISTGKKVAFAYTLTVDNEIVDSSEGRDPLNYVQGSGQIIPGLDRQMEGLKIGEEKTITVLPEEGYGQVNPEALKEVPKKMLPQGLEPHVGMYLQLQGPNGQSLPVKVSEVKNESVILDLNHPLAGKTLNFQVKIVSIE